MVFQGKPKTNLPKLVSRTGSGSGTIKVAHENNKNFGQGRENSSSSKQQSDEEEHKEELRKARQDSIITPEQFKFILNHSGNPQQAINFKNDMNKNK